MKMPYPSLISRNIKAAITTSAIAASCMFASSSYAATYQVIDTGNVDFVRYTYAQQQNAANQAILSGRETYNFPVQFQYFDEDDFDAIEALAERDHEIVHDLNEIEDREALEAGEPTANDLAWTIRYLQLRNNSNEYQKYGDTLVLHNIMGSAQELQVFDTGFDGDPNASQLTRSTIDYANGITPSGTLFGNASAPYLPVDFTDSDNEDITFWVREFSSKAFISPDAVTIIPIEAVENTYGGRSAIIDMNDQQVAVGNSSVSLNEDAVDFIERTDDNGCSDPDTLEDLPLEVCIQGVEPNLYHENAFMWTIDADNNVVGKDLGTLIKNPHEDDERAFQSTAVAINEAGLAVGYSHAWIDDDVAEPSSNQGVRVYAAIFKDQGDNNIDFTDRDEWLQSRALDINDNGIVTGYMDKFINGSLRTKFYYADSNADEITAVFPEDFFNGSSSVAQAINNNGMIVGEGEVETHNDSTSNPRRRHGFLYDINEDTFTDINDFLSCTSPYTIVEVRDINDENEIFATALIKDNQLDSKGEPMLDDEGNVRQVDILRAVLLQPIDGEIEDCSEKEEKVKREGASFGFNALFLLLLVGIRRFKS